MFSVVYRHGQIHLLFLVTICRKLGSAHCRSPGGSPWKSVPEKRMQWITCLCKYVNLLGLVLQNVLIGRGSRFRETMYRTRVHRICSSVKFQTPVQTTCEG